MRGDKANEGRGGGGEDQMSEIAVVRSDVGV